MHARRLIATCLVATMALLAVEGALSGTASASRAQVGPTQAISPGTLYPGQKLGEVAIEVTRSTNVAYFNAESPHPYANNFHGNWYGAWRNIEGASRFAMHFSKIDTEPWYDFVYMSRWDGTAVSAKVSGLHPDYWLTANWGRPYDAPLLTLSTDYSIVYWGFQADRYVGIYANPNPYSCINSPGVGYPPGCAVAVSLANYGYGYNEERDWTIGVRGVDQIGLHFSRINMASGDYVRVITAAGGVDSSIPQVATDYTTTWYPGSHVQVQMTSDGANNGQGFTIDRVYIRWGWGAFHSGYGPKDTFGSRGFFYTGGNFRVDNDLTTFAEIDTSGKAKLIKQLAYSPELEPCHYRDWLTYVCTWVADVTFQILLGEGAGPVALDGQIYMDDGTTPITPPAPQLKVDWGASVGLGASYYGITAGIGVSFTIVDPGVTVSFKNSNHEGYAYIPVSNGDGKSQNNAIEVVWKLVAGQGANGWYTFRTRTVMHIHQYVYFALCHCSYTYEGYETSSDVALYSTALGTTAGWVTGVLAYGSTPSAFSYLDARLTDMTMTGWRDNFGPNGWQEMDNRHSYFLVNEAGYDAPSWIRIAGPMTQTHSVTFAYYQWTAASGWTVLNRPGEVYDTSWTTPARPPGLFYMPSATWCWGGSTPPTGSYKAEIRVDGYLVSQLTFYLSS